MHACNAQPPMRVTFVESETYLIGSLHASQVIPLCTFSRTISGISIVASSCLGPVPA